MRKIVRESNTGVKDVFKKRILLTLRIVGIRYYAGEFLGLEIKGKNMVENEFIKLNQYHTINLMINIPLTIKKTNWDDQHHRIIRDLSNPTHDSEVAALVMEEGIAHLCYVKSSITLVKCKIEKNIPKKKIWS